MCPETVFLRTWLPLSIAECRELKRGLGDAQICGWGGVEYALCGCQGEKCGFGCGEIQNVELQEAKLL